MDDSMRIACCITCTLADAMKDCKKCPFRVGLPFRETRLQEMEQDALKPTSNANQVLMST